MGRTMKMSTRELRNQIEEQKALLGRLMECSPTKSNIDQIRKATLKIDDLEAQEEEMWHQRSRQNWLTEGDKNTAFFHQKASQRRRANAINRLQVGNDQWEENEERIEELLMDYFNDLYKSRGVNDVSKITDLFQPRITAEMNQKLMRHIHREKSTMPLCKCIPQRHQAPTECQPYFFSTTSISLVRMSPILCFKFWVATIAQGSSTTLSLPLSLR